LSVSRYDLWNVGAAVGGGSAGGGGNFAMGPVAHALPAYPPPPLPGYGVAPPPAPNSVYMQGAYGYGWGVVASAGGQMGQPFYPNQQHGGSGNGSGTNE